MENPNFLKEQIITYIGNKRSLLDFIGQCVKQILKTEKKEKLDIFDVFSGSGVVSRYFKQYSNNLYVNDMEEYCYIINKCYLANKSDIDFNELHKWHEYLINQLSDEKLLNDGFVRRLYSPVDDNDIKANERVFYTSRNAKYIDTCRQIIENVPEPYRTLFLGNLLYEASVKNNTCGVFKGFYKNKNTKIGQFGGTAGDALKRIKSNIQISEPVFSNYNCNVFVYKGDSNKVCKEIPAVDLAYLDPPYNQHPYGSNYFMLNLIANYVEPQNISRVSGIPVGWNKSSYNKKNDALKSLNDLCHNIKAKYLLISFNSEGFITFDDMVKMLKSMGKVSTYECKYNVFRACRNLSNRDIHVYEYLFLLKKE